MPKKGPATVANGKCDAESVLSRLDEDSDTSSEVLSGAGGDCPLGGDWKKKTEGKTKGRNLTKQGGGDAGSLQLPNAPLLKVRRI